VEVDIQYRVMRAIAAASDVPIAPLVGYEARRDILGEPFFVMGFVDGFVPAVQPPYTVDGFFTTAAPDERGRLLDDGLRVHAAIHGIDWQAAGLDWLIAPDTRPGTAAQLAIWERYLRRELGGRTVPVVDEAVAWLQANVPTDEPTVLCWGDARPGNMIWHDFRCVCVTDFENASIGAAGSDLGWWLMFDRCSHERAGVPRLDGEPTRDEQRRRYAFHAGRLPGHLEYHEIFAAVRYAAIHVRILNRMEARGQVPGPAAEMWRQNSATACITELMG
jgi:aminoglycoside phosphotransferase (APT) family kinase protein